MARILLLAVLLAGCPLSLAPDDGVLIELTPHTPGLPKATLVYSDYNINNQNGTLNPVLKAGWNIPDFEGSNPNFAGLSLEMEGNVQIPPEAPGSVEFHIVGLAPDGTNVRAFSLLFNPATKHMSVSHNTDTYTWIDRATGAQLMSVGAGQLVVHGPVSIGSQYQGGALRQWDPNTGDWHEIVRVANSQIYLGQPPTAILLGGPLKPSGWDQPNFRTESEGPHGGSSSWRTGNRNPEGCVHGSPGDMYIRSSGANSAVCQYRGTAPGTVGWVCL